MSLSFRCFSSQSVSTSASGCAYSVGCIAIGKFPLAFAPSKGFSAESHDRHIGLRPVRPVEMFSAVFRQQVTNRLDTQTTSPCSKTGESDSPQNRISGVSHAVFDDAVDIGSMRDVIDRV